MVTGLLRPLPAVSCRYPDIFLFSSIQKRTFAPHLGDMRQQQFKIFLVFRQVQMFIVDDENRGPRRSDKKK